MEWLEKHPLPTTCKGCSEEDCYNCDTAGERWYLTEIDNQLAQIEQALDEPNVQITQELWETCLWICIQAGDVERYNRLWNKHPDLADNMIRDFYEVAAKNPVFLTEEEIRASWERFKVRMREEYGEDLI